MKYSDLEQKIIDKMMTDPDREWSLEDITDDIQGLRKPREKGREYKWRRRVLNAMRWLMIKSEIDPEITVSRTTAVGRGNFAKYCIKKHNGDIVKKPLPLSDCNGSL